MGHEYMGHEYTGQKYTGHECMGHGCTANPVYPEAPPNACQTIANTAIKNIHIMMRRPM